MTDLVSALSDLIPIFEKLGTPYVVMGGMAVRVYGIPRPTYDLDFTLAIDRERLPDLYAAVRERGYTVPEEFAAGWVDQVAGMPVVKFRLYVEGHGIDLDVFLAESAFQKQVLARRRLEKVNGLPAWLVSPEDLILLKLLAHRPRDIGDVGDIFFTQGTLDSDYMRHWADTLGLRDALERIIEESSAP